MAPSASAAAAGSVLGAGLLCALRAGAGHAFVAAPGGGVGQLRGAGGPANAAEARQQAPQGIAGAKSGGLAASAAASALVVAVGAAAARRAAATPRRAAEGKEIAEATIPRPEDLLESPKFPLYMGATGGYMSKATKERHAITWTAKGEDLIELPTGVSAIMNKGENLCYFRKKEQCIAVGKALRKMKIENYKIYRIAKDGTVTFLHPADGVFPEKVNKGRVQVNGRPFTIGENCSPSDVKWTKYHMKSYEADPLTTKFVKARLKAFADVENLFGLPNPTGWVDVSEAEDKSGSL